MTEYVYGWSYWTRLRGSFYTVEAPTESAARRMVRERFNLRSTRGMSIVTRGEHDTQVARLAQATSREGHDHE